jgi:hypothetical protein
MTSGAYSFDRYGVTEWRRAIRMMDARGFTEMQITAVLYSKWMRWAADAANHERGRATDLERYLDVHVGGRIYKQIAELAPGEPTEQIISRAKPTPSGADLAGFCEGEDIADLINLAIATRDEASLVANNPKDAKLALQVLRDRAAAILARIERMAK